MEKFLAYKKNEIVQRDKANPSITTKRYKSCKNDSSIIDCIIKNKLSR